MTLTLAGALRILAGVLVLCTAVLDGHDVQRFLLLAIMSWLVADTAAGAR